MAHHMISHAPYRLNLASFTPPTFSSTKNVGKEAWRKSACLHEYSPECVRLRLNGLNHGKFNPYAKVDLAFNLYIPTFTQQHGNCCVEERWERGLELYWWVQVLCLRPNEETCICGRKLTILEPAVMYRTFGWLLVNWTVSDRLRSILDDSPFYQELGLLSLNFSILDWSATDQSIWDRKVQVLCPPHCNFYLWWTWRLVCDRSMIMTLSHMNTWPIIDSFQPSVLIHG